MKKVLFIATVVQKHINVFHLPFLKMFQEEGFITYVAAANDTNEKKVNIPYCDQYVEIPFKRNPFHPGNIKAYLKLKKLICDNDFEIIHCHTPVGGVLGRLAASKARRNGTRVFYTAHGFHFYKGAPVKNWLVYYPVEWLCAHFTDVLITINQEDYALAQKHMHAKRVEYVPGVGVDVEKFANVKVDRNAKRRELGIPEDAFLLLSVGELNENKNHQIVIKALAELKNPNIHYAIAGKGDLHDYLIGLAYSLGVASQVHLLGYRSDVAELYRYSDIYMLPSIREGLNVSIMEAMASGLPVVCSVARGNIDLIDDLGGRTFNSFDAIQCKNCIEALIKKSFTEMGLHNQDKIKAFGIEYVMKKMKGLYFGWD